MAISVPPWEKYAAQQRATPEEGPWTKYAQAQQVTGKSNKFPPGFIPDKPQFPAGFVPDEPNLPAGFVLDNPNLPAGFVLDNPQQAQPAGPTQFEKDRSGGTGFLANLGDSMGASSAPTSKLGALKASATSGMPALGVIKGMYDTAMSAPRHAREEYAADKNMGPLGRIAAAGGAALSPMLGIDPDRMRASANQGDTGGVLGQIAGPTMMALGPLASEALPTGEEVRDAVGRRLRTPGTLERPKSISTLKPGVRAASGVLNLFGGQDVANALIPAHPNPRGWAVPLPGIEGPGGASGRISSTAVEPEPPVLLIPEPRAPFRGETPGYMSSVPRDELSSLAKTGKPGAGKQLQQLGRRVLYVPKGQ